MRSHHLYDISAHRTPHSLGYTKNLKMAETCSFYTLYIQYNKLVVFWLPIIHHNKTLMRELQRFLSSQADNLFTSFLRYTSWNYLHNSQYSPVHHQSSHLCCYSLPNYWSQATNYKASHNVWLPVLLCILFLSPQQIF